MLWASIRRGLRRLHGLRESDPIGPEFRGWSWDRPPLKPRAFLGLGVSEIAWGSECGFRSLWRRRRGLSVGVSESMRIGLTMHEVFHRASRDLRRLIARGVEPWHAYVALYSTTERKFKEGWARELYRIVLMLFAGEASGAKALYGGEGAGSMPWLTEYMVDGSPLGLSRRIRVDALGEAGLLVEIKYGRNGRWQQLSLAGYALAMEAHYESPIDYGVLIHVSGPPRRRPVIGVEPVYLSQDLREEFVLARDEAIDYLLSDREPPEVGCNRSNGGGLHEDT